MKKSYSNLRSLLFVCAVFVLSSFYAVSAFSQCNPAANDASFNPLDEGFGRTDGATSTIKKFIKLSTNKILAASLSYGNRNRRLFRLTEDGVLDDSFVYLSFGTRDVNDLVELPNGQILIAGEFSDAPNRRIVRLNPDGDVDNSFSNSFFDSNSDIRNIFLQADNKLIITGGLFVNGVAKSVVRMNSDGSLDPTFTQGLVTGQRANITDAVIQNDGKIVVVGHFTQ